MKRINLLPTSPLPVIRKITDKVKPTVGRKLLPLNDIYKVRCFVGILWNLRMQLKGTSWERNDKRPRNSSAELERKDEG